ncbi:MAG: hypothetical protein HY332_12755 [Chloroflexi bacterium]|nr:hypothetical protein [Chloroflexota bacterium]
MYSSVIGKVQKAHQYAREPERIRVERLAVAFHGDNDDHQVSYEHGKWRCTCHFFAGWGICSHTMALEQLLGVMVPTKQHYPVPAPEERAAPAGT